MSTMKPYLYIILVIEGHVSQDSDNRAEHIGVAAVGFNH